MEPSPEHQHVTAGTNVFSLVVFVIVVVVVVLPVDHQVHVAPENWLRDDRVLGGLFVVSVVGAAVARWQRSPLATVAAWSAVWMGVLLAWSLL